MKYRVYNDTLNPAIWNGEAIKPEVAAILKKIANDFYIDAKLDIPLEDIILIGSSANFNWTPKSDLDLHLVLDLKRINPDLKQAQIYADSIKSKWNDQHDIHFGPHNVEVYLQDKTATPVSTGVFSIIKNQWLQKPSKQEISLQKDVIQSKYREFKTKINDAISRKDVKSLKSLVDDIYNYRQVGLTKGGEISNENVVFKLLRQAGHLDKLKNHIVSLYDKSVSSP